MDKEVRNHLGACVSVGLAMFISMTGQTRAAAIAWGVDADGVWEDVNNWVPASVPSATDDVQIDVGGATVRTVSINANQSIQSVSSEENLHLVGGNLSVQPGVGSLPSVVNGLFTMDGVRRLSVTSGSFTAPLAVIDGANLTATAGAQISLGAATYVAETGGGTFDSRSLTAETGSVLDLSRVTRMTGCVFIRTLFVNARGGSLVDFSGVLKNDVGATRYAAADPMSQINLSAMTDFADTNTNSASMLSASGGGLVNAASLVNANALNLVVDGSTSSVNVPSLSSYLNGTVTLTNAGTIDLSLVSDATGSSFLVRDGVTLQLGGLSTYAASGAGNDNRTFEADNTSALDASTITSAAGGGFITTWVVNARNAGRVDLSGLAEITSGATKFRADGVGSLIDLSALTGFLDNNGNRASELQAINGGQILLSTNPADTLSFTNVDIVLNNDGSSMDVSRLITFDGGVFTSNGVAATLNVTAIPNSSFIAREGSVLDLATVSGAVSKSMGGGRIAYRAEGMGSIVRANNITDLENSSTTLFTGFDITAGSGGQVQMTGLTSITNIFPIINSHEESNLIADGIGSEINVPALQEFSDIASDTLSSIQVINGGVVNLNQTGTVQLTNITVTVDTGGVMSADTVELISVATNTSGSPLNDLSVLRGNGNLDFNILNTSGVMSAGTPAAGISTGQFTVSGRYTEAVDARTEVEILDAGHFDSLRVSGAVSLAGTLNVTLNPAFDLLAGMKFKIIDAAGVTAVSGNFAGLPQNAEVLQDNGIPLYIDYAGGDGNDVVLTTVLNYPVSGSLSGLAAGNTVVLQNNGTDDLSLISNGSFTFHQKIDDGSPYDVSVLTQPINPDQECTVTNGSGNVTGADIINVSVDCVNLYALTVVNAGNGSVSSVPAGIDCGVVCSAEYLAGTAVGLTAAYNPEWTLGGWNWGGACSGSGACSVTMNTAETVNVGFYCSLISISAPVLPIDTLEPPWECHDLEILDGFSVIAPNGEVSFRAQNSIRFAPGLSIGNGAVMRATIIP
jgi:hypothetical protein